MFHDNGAMSGRLCLVTGATSGIGQATALGLAALGARVILVGRDAGRCAATAARIRCTTGSAAVEYLVADLAQQGELRSLVADFRKRYRQLDVLVNNAGARFDLRQENADGLEMSFALNHLAPFTLTNLLLQELLSAPQGRIVNVSSSAHRACGALDWEDLQSRHGYRGKKAYALSKLANLLFTYELARQLRGTALTVNAADPGNVLTGFARNNGWISWARHIVGSLRSGGLVGPHQGAGTCLYLACAPELAGVSGRYFSRCAPVASSPLSQDPVAAQRLWAISSALAGFTSTHEGGSP